MLDSSSEVRELDNLHLGSTGTTKQKYILSGEGGGVASTIAYLLSDPAALGSIPSVPKNFKVRLGKG